MNKLIITAHPSTKGFTHKIAQNYKKGSIESNHKVEILDLYAKENHQDFLIFENKENFGEDKNRKIFQEKILKADELIFIFPVWWADAPAILKNFIDTNFEAGIFYKYTKTGVNGSLKGKKVKIFATCDAPGIIYKFFLFPLNLGKMWGFYRLKFCGIKKINFILFDRMRKRDEKNKEKLLNKVYKLSKKD